MKTKLTVSLAAVILLTAAQTTHAQTNWRTAGNNVLDGHHLGSNNNRSLIITTNGQERMRVDSVGDITMGSNIGPLHFLFFGTSFHMKFPQDQYIFRHSNSQEGLYRNQTLQRIEYRDPVSVPNMWVQSSSAGNAYFRGNMGIGTETPGAKLHLNSSVAGEIAKFNGGANSMFMGLYENGSYRGYIGSYSGNNEDVDFGTGGGTTGKLHLTIQANPRLTIDNTGRTGIGTTTPEANLHVFRASAGTVTANANAPLVVENSTSNYINLLTPSANERGILFGDNLNNSDGGIIYTGTTNQMQLRTNGNITRVFIDDDGNTGVGVDPISGSGFNDARLQVSSDGDDNVRLVAADNTNDWSIFSQDGATGVLALYKNGSFRGSFDATTGEYSATSDARLKKDVLALPSIMEDLMKLQPKKYHFKESTGSEKYSYGFIAQEVNEIFPEFVHAVKDRKTGDDILSLSYNNFGVIAVKAIQEQQKQIEAQKKELDELKEMVKQLAGGQSLSSVNSAASKTTNALVSDAVLEQNKPNPLTGNTSIRYSIPGGAKNAQLIITDLAGKTVKQIALNNATAGTVNIDASMLGSGTYNYTLYADGKLIGSKKMIVNR